MRGWKVEMSLIDMVNTFGSVMRVDRILAVLPGQKERFTKLHYAAAKDQVRHHPVQLF